MALFAWQTLRIYLWLLVLLKCGLIRALSANIYKTTMSLDWKLLPLVL